MSPIIMPKPNRNSFKTTMLRPSPSPDLKPIQNLLAGFKNDCVTTHKLKFKTAFISYSSNDISAVFILFRWKYICPKCIHIYI